MYEIKDVAQDIKAAAKRRVWLLVLTPVLFVLAGLVAIYFIEPKYQSTTTILVQKDETLNPLVLYEIAVQIVKDDRIQSLNEIVYSRSTMEILIDSLDLDSQVRNEAEKQLLIAKTQKNIGTRLRSNDAFEISYIDSDPVRARDGATLLTNHFINSKLLMETRKHEEMVHFFSSKLEELELIVAEQRSQTVAITSNRMLEMPSSAAALQDRLQVIDNQIDNVSWRLIQEEDKLSSLRAFNEEADVNQGVDHLYKLPLAEMQFGDELVLLLNEYDTIRQQYTDSYPRLQTLAVQIRQVSERIPPVLTTNIERLRLQKQEFTSQKQRVVNDMQQYFVASQRANSQLSDFSIYEGLQAEMRVKLEQAKMTRDIGIQAADQFIVLDTAVIAEKPVSPNKLAILSVGLLLGLVLGIVVSVVAEVLDTTLRDARDMPYEKPIIAYITNG